MARPIVQAISLEKFHSTDLFAKTAKLFHLEQFATYNVCVYVHFDLNVQTFDVMVTEKPVNLAYSSGSLPLHNDLVMYKAPPGIQMLHCIRSVAYTPCCNDTLSVTHAGMTLLGVNHDCWILFHCWRRCVLIIQRNLTS